MKATNMKAPQACVLYAMLVVLLSSASSVGAEKALKYPVTEGSAGKIPLWTDTPIVSPARHGTRIYCATSHLSYDDPIVHPGAANAAHLHTFWGNTGANFESTGASLLNSGNSSCEGGTNNRSAYWSPTVFDQSDQAVIPKTTFVYYKSFGNTSFDRTTIQPIPNGLKMLANDQVKNSKAAYFKTSSQTSAGRAHLKVSVSFPTCVAVDDAGAPVLSSDDNTRHLAYGSGDDGNSNNCPNSHPYRIPQVSYHLLYDVNPASNWYLASDASAATQGESLHADYIAAWDPRTMSEVVRCNVESRRSCEFGEKVGHRSHLPERFNNPDGTAIYEYGVLKADADRTPFGATLNKMSSGAMAAPAVSPPSAPSLKVSSLSHGSGWVVFSAGPNAGKS